MLFYIVCNSGGKFLSLFRREMARNFRTATEGNIVRFWRRMLT
jgi:hypothetical protein